MNLALPQINVESERQLLTLQTLYCAYTQQTEELTSYQLQAVDYKQQAHYWKEQFSRSKERESDLKSEIAELKAKLRKREQQLFGKKTEKAGNKSELQTINTKQTKPKKSRGQQPGSQGHGRRDYSHLPEEEETLSLSPDDRHCPCCGLCYETLAGTEDSEVIEIINVKAYRRKIKRKSYRRKCQCRDNPDPSIITAPTADKIYPKSKLGLTVWAHLLLRKYEYQ